MSQLQERIAQFRKMTENVPDDELGHYRLGQLLMEDQQHDEAINSFRRTLDISPQFSKVYQLLGECLIKLGRKDEAIDTLKVGYGVADERGDKIPRDAMGMLLQQLGAEVPKSATTTTEVDDGTPGTGFRCARPGCAAGKKARQLSAAPLPDAMGQRIYQSICSDCWTDWFRNYSIKVINELRIDLSTEFGQGEYDKYMRGFFGFED